MKPTNKHTTPGLFLLTTIALVLLCSCSSDATAPQEFSLKQAEQILFIQILNSNDSGKTVYELPTKMRAGSTVRAKGGDSLHVSAVDSWFFFIDDKPGYRWVHPCRYAFVACRNGTPTVAIEQNEPENLDSLVLVHFR